MTGPTGKRGNQGWDGPPNKRFNNKGGRGGQGGGNWRQGGNQNKQNRNFNNRNNNRNNNREVNRNKQNDTQLERVCHLLINHFLYSNHLKRSNLR